MSTTAGSGVEVTAIDTPALGDRSYLAHDGEVALVVDPQRDVDRVLALAASRGVRIRHVFETHLPSGADLSPPRRADAAELHRRIEAGEWVVDLRARRAFAAGHVAGTLSFDLDGSFATYLGWLIPWGTPLTLLGHTPGQVAEAQRELVRIGIDRPAAAATGSPADWAGGRGLRSYPVADFADLEAVRRHRPIVVLDVRRDQEWEVSHIAGAVHIPIHQLPARLADVPGGEVWVHCEAGYRASVSASLLDAAGRTVVAVDDEYGHAGRAGLPLDGPVTHAAGRVS